MKKTYAYNSIIIGFVVGLWVAVSSNNIVLAILAGLGVAVVGFVVIKALEKLLDKAGDKAVDAVTNAYQKHKQNKDQ